jgi:hypothetical protein
MAEPNSNSVGRSVRYWVRALTSFGGKVSQIAVPRGAVVELNDEFLDAPEFPPSAESDWFQLDGSRFEVYLDDGKSTIRLANRRIMLELLASPEYPLVTWFGHRPEDYELILRKKSDDPAGGGQPTLDLSKLVWVGWAHADWHTNLFDGFDVIPVTQAAGDGAFRPEDEEKVTWMGWDGDHLDIFTVRYEQAPPNASAIFVGSDGSVIAVRKRTS